jgi:ADP-ribosylation factor related protein 1
VTIPIEKSQLRFWDLGGQTELQKLWKQYYHECHSVLFVIDSSDNFRLEEVQRIFREVVQDHDTEGVPILLLANKQDQENSMTVVQLKEAFNEIAVIIDARESNVLPISALSG